MRRRGAATVGVLAALAIAGPARASTGWASYLGSDGRDTAERVVTDAAGNLYVTGWVEGKGRIAARHEGIDVYVAKLAANGEVLYATVFGGAGNDLPASLAVDADGRVLVAGTTNSEDFPVVGAEPAGAVGVGAAFVTKLDRDGELLASTFVGGNNAVSVHDIALDAAGNPYVTGYALATDLPVTAGALQPQRNGPFDAFVLGFDGDLALRVCTYLGGGGHPLGGFGAGYDEGYGIAVAPGGDVLVAGVTDAPDFPSASAIPLVPHGQRDAFLARLSPDGTRLVASTRIGGAGDDQASELTVDGAGAVYLVGRTGSPDFPALNAPQRLPGSLTDAFAAKVAPDGATLAYATFLGGDGNDFGYDVAVDTAGRATYVGQTASTNFPVVGGAQTARRGTADGFVTRLSADGAAIESSTYLGGSNWDGLTGVQAVAGGGVLVSGFMYSADMPSLRPFGGGQSDGYVAHAG